MSHESVFIQQNRTVSHHDMSKFPRILNHTSVHEHLWQLFQIHSSPSTQATVRTEKESYYKDTKQPYDFMGKSRSCPSQHSITYLESKLIKK